jgi:hypothetical protein
VVESADYKLTISAPVWRLTPEEEARRAIEAAQGFSGFMKTLSNAVDAEKHEVPEDKEWDEFDYEKFMRECDARTDKYAELLDKYMDHPDSDRIIAKEMGWTWLEEALDAQDAEKLEGKASENESAQEFENEGEEEDASDEDEDEIGFFAEDDAQEPVPDPETEGVDWIRDEHGRLTHPLCKRVREGNLALRHKCENKSRDKDLAALVDAYQITSAKLAGALEGLAYGRELRDGAFVVAYLKRALSHLHGAQAALETVAAKKSLAEEVIASTRTELFAIREEILRLMTEFRAEG